MLKGQKKLRQKEIKKDKLVTAYFESREWLSNQENKKRIYIAIGVLLAIIAVIFIYSNSKKAKNEEAELKLSMIISLYEANKFNEAINGDQTTNPPTMGLLEIVNNYGSTQAGETAKFYLANCYYNLHDYDNAAKYFEDYSGKHDIIKASCLSGLGAVYEAKGDMKKAADFYDKSIKIDKDLVINQENIYYAIRAYSKAGDKDNAKKLYDQMRHDYPKSKYIAEVKKMEAEFTN